MSTWDEKMPKFKVSIQFDIHTITCCREMPTTVTNIILMNREISRNYPY
jgi:hypothetical protein